MIFAMIVVENIPVRSSVLAEQLGVELTYCKGEQLPQRRKDTTVQRPSNGVRSIERSAVGNTVSTMDVD